MPKLNNAKYLNEWASRHPSYPFKDILEALSHLGIKTDYDLLMQPELLVKTPVALHQGVKELRIAVMDRLACPGQTADSLLNDLDDSPDDMMPTMGQIHELCHPTLISLTPLVLQLSARHLHSINTERHLVYYLQSGQLSISQLETTFRQQTEDIRQMMEAMLVVDCPTLDQLLVFLSKYSEARHHMWQQQGASRMSRDLLVIDSIRPLVLNAWQTDAESVDFKIHAIRTCLRRLTHTLRTAVLITNGTSRETGKPSLGSEWLTVSHRHIFI